MRAILLLAVFAVTLLLMQTQLTPSDPAEVAAPDPQRIEAGRQIYLNQYCGTCHQLDVANTRGNFGPEHNQAALHAEQWLIDSRYSGSATTVEEYLRESILEPQVFYTPGYENTNHHMPAFTHLPYEDVEAMVYLLAHQR